MAAILLCFVSGLAKADTVWLNNGDRISGTVQSLDRGILRISTSYGGDIEIAFNQVATLQTDGELVVRDGSYEHDYRAKLQASDKGQVTVLGTLRGADATTPVDAQVALSSVDSLVRPHPVLSEAAFTGRIDLAANHKSASTTTQSYSAGVQAGLRHGLWRHALNTSYVRSKEEGRVNTNNYGLDYTLDRFLSEKTFWQGRLMHKRDWIEDLSRQTAYGTGPGYQFWDDERGAFSMSVLLGRVHYGYANGGSGNDYAASLRWDYVRYFRGKQFELYTHGELLRPLGSTADVALSAEAGARYNINSWLSLYLKYSRNQVVNARESLNESIYGTGIGVAW